MATFQTQIEDLTGSVGDTAALTQWLTDGAKEIINVLPPSLKIKCASISILNADNGTTLDMDAGGDILSITRKSASDGYYIPCREIPSMYGDLANDSSNLMYYGSSTDPVFWITSNSSGASTLFVKPTSTNTQPSNVYRIAYPAVAFGDSVIANFPNEAEYLVVLYASIKGLHRLMNDKSSSLPSDVGVISLSEVSTSLPVYTSTSGVVIPSSLSDADIDFSSIGSKETYTSPVFATPVLGSISSMSFVSSPTKPVMTVNSVTISGTAPTYSKPTITTVPSWPTFSGIAIPATPLAPSAPSFTYTNASVSDIVAPIISISDKVALTASAPTYSKPTITTVPTWPSSFASMNLPTSPPSPSLTDLTLDTSSITAPTYTASAVAPDFGDANEWINTEEDSEMLNARISVINSQISEFNAKINNEVNVFNEEVEVWKEKVQKEIKNIDLKDTKEKNKLEKYSQEVGVYQAQVNTEVQRWVSEEYNTKIQEYTLKYQYFIQQYAQDIQNEVNEYNKEVIVYKEDIARKTENFQKEINQAIKRAELDIQTKGQNLTKETNIALQNALKNYEKDVSEYQATMQKYVQDLDAYKSQSSLAIDKWLNEEYNPKIQEYSLKYGNFLQQYAQDIQNELNEFNKENVEYQSKLQKDLRDADLSEARDARELQLYANEISLYQADVNKEVQRWTAEVYTKEFNEWKQNYDGSLQEYGTNIQNESAKIGAALNNYKTEVDKAINKYQTETGYDLSKHKLDLDKEIQRFTQDLAKNTQEFANDLQKYTAEVSKISSDNQSKIAKYGQDLANYSAKIQKQSVDYKWYQGQYAQLKMEYNQGLQMLISGGLPQEKKENK